jgi:hypothetical protein
MKATKPDGTRWSRLGVDSCVRRSRIPRQVEVDGNEGRAKHIGDCARWRKRHHRSYPEFQIACKGSFDGKDYPMTGAGATMKQTLAFREDGIQLDQDDDEDSWQALLRRRPDAVRRRQDADR